MKYNKDRRTLLKHEESFEQHAHLHWKIAYADFMTTLMTLFLILWILSDDRSGMLEEMEQNFKPTLSFHLGQYQEVKRPLYKKNSVLKMLGDKILGLNNRNNFIISNKDVDSMVINIVDKDGVFEENSDVFTKSGAAAIGSLMPAINSIQNFVQVTCYALPSEDDQWGLSFKRAYAFASLLQKNGFSADQIVQIAAGGTANPIDEVNVNSKRNIMINITITNEELGDPTQVPLSLN